MSGASGQRRCQPTGSSRVPAGDEQYGAGQGEDWGSTVPADKTGNGREEGSQMD